MLYDSALFKERGKQVLGFHFLVLSGLCIFFLFVFLIYFELPVFS